jgi:peptidoglycan hydrolase CwlO-like protein
VYLEGVVEEYKASEKSLTERNEYLEQEVARLEKEKGELEYELSQLKNNKQFFDKIIEWLNNLLKKVFGGK